MSSSIMETNVGVMENDDTLVFMNRTMQLFNQSLSFYISYVCWDSFKVPFTNYKDLLS